MPFLSPAALAIAWPSVIPTSSTVWCASMCRSPLASIEMSISPWRATCFCMCSKNGRPVMNVQRPSPSRLTLTVICVSLVLRVTLAVRFMADVIVSYGLFQGIEEARVFFRRPHGHAQTAGEHGVTAIQILDEHLLFHERGEHGGGRRAFGPEQNEVGGRWPDAHGGQFHQFIKERFPIAADFRRLLVEHHLMLQRELGACLR